MSDKTFESRFLYLRWDLLRVSKNMLCIRRITNNNGELKICLLHEVVSWHLPDSEVGGHVGMKKTFQILVITCSYPSNSGN